MVSEPLTGKRYNEVTEQKTKADWAEFINKIADYWFKDAPKIMLVMGQCLDRRIDNPVTMKKEVQAWQTNRNNKESKVKWQFTCENARIKLPGLYPLIQV